MAAMQDLQLKHSARLPTALRLALRDLRGGLSGFYVFVACVALGVAVIAGVGALGEGIRTAFERQGAVLLGGDFAVTRAHRPLDEKERAWLAARGRISELATLRALARNREADEQALVEVKAVDAAYPLVGEVALEGGADFDAAIRQSAGAVVDPIVLERLGLKVGDSFDLGNARIRIAGVIRTEPDRIVERAALGPRVMIALATLDSTGLVKPGSLMSWRARLLLPPGTPADAPAMKRMREELRRALPESGFMAADHLNPSPGLTKGIDRLRQFLTLLGLAALIVGGVGVANAVATFIDRKRKAIATFKSLGASSRLIFQVYLIEILAITGVGVAIGLLLGYLIPLTLTTLYADALPIKAELNASPQSLALAAAYGFLVSLMFMLWPLGRSRQVRASVLFRDEISDQHSWPGRGIVLITLALCLAVIAFAVLTSEFRLIALYFCGATAGVLGVFFAVGWGLSRLARRLPRPRVPEAALALGNLGAPGGLTSSVVLSLGAGLTLLTAVALVDHAFVAELSGRIPKAAPSYFFLNVARSERDAFVALLNREAPDARLGEATMLRGRIVALADRPVEQIKPPAEAEWVLNGDRGLTYSEDVPEGSTITAGSWWPKDYAGEPLVSFDGELARHLGLKLGDKVTVNVLGRNISAKVSSFREVKWDNLNINFVMVFSPNTLRSAPHALVLTLTLPETARLATEARVAQQVGKAFPSVTPIRVKDALEQFEAVFAKVMVAVRVAGSVTLLAGALVLAGALATAQRRRVKEAVILKALGATRARILKAHALEYLMLAAVSALLAGLLGTLAAWVTLRKVMELSFSFSPYALLQSIGLSIVLVLIFGGLGTWRVLQARPVPYLRGE